jgi:deoxyribose-phosphate aldolase
MTTPGQQGAGNQRDITASELARRTDHTLLKAEATHEDVLRLCAEAREHGFHTVCTNGRWLPLVAEQLHGSRVKVGGVVSLPLGADTTKVKVAQAKDAVRAGADEIDMVADLAAVVEGDASYLLHQFRHILRVCRSMRPPVLLKVIVESAALTSEQKVFACEVAQQGGVDFVKTSTGLHPAGGATVEDVRLMKGAAPRCKIKAAGGIRTLEQALAILNAGADRIGTSAGVRIIDELKAARET